jgi:hypothetical protein
MPETTLRWQSFNHKKPYFIASVFSLVLVVFVAGWLFGKLAAAKDEAIKDLGDKITPIANRADKFHKVHSALQKSEQEAGQVAGWMQARYYWSDIFSELRRVMIEAEKKTKDKFSTETGVWVENFAVAGAPVAQAAAPVQAADDEGRPAATPAPAQSAPDAGGDIASFTITCRAVRLGTLSESVKTDTAFAVLNELKASPLFVAEETQFIGNISPDEPPGTFTFGIVVKLKQPFKL